MLNRCAQWGGHHDHTRPPAIGSVVNRSSSILGKRPWVYSLDRDDASSLATTNDACLAIGIQQLREKSYDGISIHHSVVEMPVDVQLTAGQINRKHINAADKWDEILAGSLDLQDIVRASLQKTAYSSELFTTAIDDAQTD